MKVIIGSDHGGFELKAAISEHITKLGYEVVDCGTHTPQSCNYPDLAQAVAKGVLETQGSLGILCCGTGIGMSMAANKVRGIRGALVSDCFSAKYTRLHNDANIMCIGQRTIGVGLALELVEIFLKTPFEGGRHKTRVDMIMDIEKE